MDASVSIHHKCHARERTSLRQAAAGIQSSQLNGGDFHTDPLSQVSLLGLLIQELLHCRPRSQG